MLPGLKRRIGTLSPHLKTGTKEDRNPYPQLVENVRTLVAQMPLEFFLTFQRELQFAVSHADIAYNVAQSHIAFNDKEHQNPIANRFYNEGHQIHRLITTSPLYEAARDRLRSGEIAIVPDCLTEWGGLTRDQIDRIIEADRKRLRQEMPFSGLLIGGVSPDQVALATDTLTEFDISGIFTGESTNEGLVTTFLQHWGEKTS